MSAEIEPNRQFSTGLPFLDRRIGGGLRAGSLLALEAPPGSQSELLLAQFLATHRTVYVTTTRPADEVRAWATAKADDVADLSVEEVAPEEFIESPDVVTDLVSPESFLIVDTTTGFETASRDRYLNALNQVKRQLRDTDSVGAFHCVSQRSPPPRRELTLNRADTVWQLEVQALSRELKTRLLVTKSRYGYTLTEPIPLLLTDRVRIDTSRSIA